MSWRVRIWLLLQTKRYSWGSVTGPTSICFSMPNLQPSSSGLHYSRWKIHSFWCLPLLYQQLSIPLGFWNIWENMAKYINLSLTASCSSMKYCYLTKLLDKKCHTVIFIVQLDYLRDTWRARTILGWIKKNLIPKSSINTTPKASLLIYLLENAFMVQLLRLNSTMLGISALPCRKTKLDRRLW